MSDSISELERQIESLRRGGEGKTKGDLNRALAALYAAQKREFEASLRRRALRLKKTGGAP